MSDDLDDVWRWRQQSTDSRQLAVMGFCFGGGKAIRYTTSRQPSASTIICYGSPVLEVDELKKLKAGVCGVFGATDVQFPMPVLDSFRSALDRAGVASDIRVYDNVGHAFLKTMNEIRAGKQPQLDAWTQCTQFIRAEWGVDGG